jgi:hypothetical protein
MEDPFFPRDPNHVFALGTGEGTCRVEELARILRDRFLCVFGFMYARVRVLVCQCTCRSRA